MGDANEATAIPGEYISYGSKPYFKPDPLPPEGLTFDDGFYETLSEATDRLEEAVIDGKTDEIERRLHELRKTADDIERAFEDRKDLLSGL